MLHTNYPDETSSGKATDNKLVEHYQQSIDAGEISADPSQRALIQQLQTVYDALLAQTSHTKVAPQSTFERWFSRQAKPTTSLVKGLYIWGGVGFGKTHMVDFFFKHLPIEKKLRLHFHRFMQLVHLELKQHPHSEDPLKQVAKSFALEARILCLDEMHINDITDAMILAKLFDHLFKLNVSLITTSNVAPTNLYKNGLQRSRFLPAIALFEKNMTVFHLDNGIDYRLKTLQQTDLYQVITAENNQQTLDHKMSETFNALVAINRHKKRKNVLINHRKIPVIKWADGIVWFTFDAICNTARSNDDYSQVACYFHTVMISGIPVLNELNDDAARRFVNMIDEFYDRHVNLIVSAEAEPNVLYTGTRLAFDFKRTSSRLIEMRSKQYLAKKREAD